MFAKHLCRQSEKIFIQHIIPQADSKTINAHRIEYKDYTLFDVYKLFQLVVP